MTVDQTSQQFHDYDSSLEERSFRFKYKGKHYIMREPSADAVAQYMDKRQSCVQYSPDGKTARVVGMESIKTLLVAMCTFELPVDEEGEVVEDGKEKAVAQATVKFWPARMQKDLYKKAELFAELSEETPERQTLDEILDRPDSPVDKDTFRKYIAELPDQDEKFDYRPFKEWYQVPAEELAKNELSDMPAGSS